MSIGSILPFILEYRYWILIPLSFVEGPIIGFVAGALSRLGYFNPFVAFSIFILRDVIVDTLWYVIGREGGKTKFASWLLQKIRVTDAHLHEVRLLWDTRGLRTMFISKLSYGISHVFLAVAGMVAMPFPRFFRLALTVAFIEYGGLFVCGYLFGNAFGSVTGLISNIAWGIAVLSLVIAGYYIFTHFMRSKAVEQEKLVLEKKP